MAYLAIGGVNHYYEWVTTARANGRTGKPVMVFLHGWGGSCRYWRSTAQALADQFDALLYDLRGFGQSGLPPEQIPAGRGDRATLVNRYALATYAEDLLTLLEQLDLDRVYLHAHSTGASIALLFLNRYGDRVEQAILTCSGIFEYDAPAFAAFHRFGGYVVQFRPRWLVKIPGIERLFMARFLHRPLAKSLQVAFLEDFLRADYDAALGVMLAAVSEQAALTMPQEFAQLQVPTLLIAGEYDQIIPAEMGRKAAALSDRITFAVVPQTAHFPMLEDPMTYLHQVQAFLQGQPAKSPF
ncbi:alpha/beta hydrolase [Trichothermofontia sichuanensis B231]|uniref:alpha/beta fold hydrolase n=1 Tax=Trichothermofontia sichuanensis TaxID=3045816 RepID=UPI002246A5EF|nr:alpha/beta hydrolase [Trichothermofontia sichuanensis]UZQ55708.1 alpha/beta hydrolase [Trichothermofontia sichuanensis B231]